MGDFPFCPYKLVSQESLDPDIIQHASRNHVFDFFGGQNHKFGTNKKWAVFIRGQTKMIFTAAFMWQMLGKKFSQNQILALAMLVLGLAAVDGDFTVEHGWFDDRWSWMSIDLGKL